MSGITKEFNLTYLDNINQFIDETNDYCIVYISNETIEFAKNVINILDTHQPIILPAKYADVIYFRFDNETDMQLTCKLYKDNTITMSIYDKSEGKIIHKRHTDIKSINKIVNNFMLNIIDTVLIFISQPMSGLTKRDILKRRMEIKKYLKNKYNHCDFIDMIKEEDIPDNATPLWYLAKSIELINTADVVYFDKEWENARGCRIEHEICLNYDKPIID